MIVVVSPAKSLKRLPVLRLNEIQKNFSKPKFKKEALQLAYVLKNKPLKDLKTILSVSDKIANLNYERYKNFPSTFRFDESYPAFFLYNGDVYKGLELDGFSKEHFDFAQEHVRILSGLYGILKPLDLIYPYRLEMGTPLVFSINDQNQNQRFSSLYDFWSLRITRYLVNELKKHKEKVLINLASVEYFKSIDQNKFPFEIITIHFQEKRKGKYTTIALNAKRARGKMLNWIIINQIQKKEKIKEFSLDNYRFSEEHSSDRDWFFLKD